MDNEGYYHRKSFYLSENNNINGEYMDDLTFLCFEKCEHFSHKAPIFFIVSPATTLPEIKSFYELGVYSWSVIIFTHGEYAGFCGIIKNDCKIDGMTSLNISFAIKNNNIFHKRKTKCYSKFQYMMEIFLKLVMGPLQYG